ncbi:efflux RND transporter periplasmic adaptor subunit [Sediminibacter sp. Hel_I_10]|uniref:efflux RND transporter periplasmic adaptor subunit n=1 Tax=Sediminibacter sp. Hel_I_10 TaxID=1392490 RepID=UPI00047E62C8|nr:HlyD family efflux transporter periplasmic adaptor subunit [Sediminibacter sp. Hel_I_10]
MRKAILYTLAVLLLIGAFFGAKALIDSKEKPKSQPQKSTKTVFVDTVENATIPISIPANGNLVAKRRVEIYSEVEGVFRYSSKLYKVGQSYSRGQTLIKIDANEYEASVQSSKSDLYNQIIAIMPDLRLDYPEVYPKWQDYLNDFDLNKTVPPLPKASSEKETYFVNGRGINTAYYTIKNLEQRLLKYQIIAPFDGVLTEALVTEGTLIRNGQKLGEFIDPEVYELQVALSRDYADLLKVGEAVQLKNNKGTEQYAGTVSRVNASIDQNTQTVSVFIEVKNDALKEGMYLQANLDAKKEENAISIDRSLVNDRNEVFIVEDGKLKTLKVNPVYFSDKTVVVKGVSDGMLLLSKQVSGAYNGMPVEIANDKKSEDTKKSEVNSENVTTKP